MTDPADLLDEIRSLEETLHRSEIRRSRQALETLLAEGFVEFGASGTVYDRADIIDLLAREADAELGDLQADDYSLRSFAADAVLLTYRTQRSRGDGSKRQVLRSSVWKRTGTGWQMLFHQGTIASDSGERFS